MTDLLAGFATGLISFYFAYSWLTLEAKHRFNTRFGNGITDTVITLGALTLAGSTFGALMTCLGIGIGLSLSLKIAVAIYGTSPDTTAGMRLKKFLTNIF